MINNILSNVMQEEEEAQPFTTKCSSTIPIHQHHSTTTTSTICTALSQKMCFQAMSAAAPLTY
jgi:hypothetical protein